MQTIHTKHEIGDSCEQQWTEKHETFYDVHPFLNEKIRHSHKRFSANPVNCIKTSHTCQQTLEKHDIPINGSQKTSENCMQTSTCLRNSPPPNSLHTQRIIQILANLYTKHEICEDRKQKWTEKHETFVMRTQFRTRKHDISTNGSQKTF